MGSGLLIRAQRLPHRGTNAPLITRRSVITAAPMHCAVAQSTRNQLQSIPLQPSRVNCPLVTLHCCENQKRNQTTTELNPLQPDSSTQTPPTPSPSFHSNYSNQTHPRSSSTELNMLRYRSAIAKLDTSPGTCNVESNSLEANLVMSSTYTHPRHSPRPTMFPTKLPQKVHYHNLLKPHNLAS